MNNEGRTREPGRGARDIGPLPRWTRQSRDRFGAVYSVEFGACRGAAGRGPRLPPPAIDGKADLDLESTSTLLDRARSGDAQARNLLFARFAPLLRRWVHGRLPAGARDLRDTDDLVQDTFLRALDRLDRFEPRHPGAFFAYLRTIARNQIIDQIRRSRRLPMQEGLHDGFHASGPSPLEEAIGADLLGRYEAAVGRLSEEHQQAVILRVELGMDYEEIAQAMERQTANAARLLVARALVKLARSLDDS